ncbi:hypothetical protein MNAN1_001446 [Malassezia nana]|uniref:Uncharacterized protein n=1 Tax=Malassezia nana TaxID=180528 RepID=A0AAF0ELC4_9BASI|nr:hypothetical protein MNAN1_001446 [Malassezia nana]
MSGLMELYGRVHGEFVAWNAWEPAIPTEYLPYIAIFSLSLAFLMAFYFTTYV